MSRKLVVSDGTRERELQLVGRLVVGRDPACDITYDDALLSRRHAEFVAAGDEVTVRDLGSRNGVFVNGTKIAERALRSGDVVQIGPVRARYVADAAPVSIAPDLVDVNHTAVLHRDAAVAPPPEPAASVGQSVPSSGPRASSGGGVDVNTVDDDRTRLIPGPRALKTPASAQPGGDDDDRTQFLRTPVKSAQPVPSAQPPSSVQSRPESGTMILPRPTSGSGVRPLTAADAQPVAPPQNVVRDPQPALRAPEPAIRSPQPAVGNPESAIRNPESATRNPLATFVFVQVLALAAIVLFAAAIPLIVWRRDVLSGVDQAGSAPMAWLAVPVAVAVIAAYCVSTLISRRFVHALADVERSRTTLRS